jgi:hypothetical protein
VRAPIYFWQRLRIAAAPSDVSFRTLSTATVRAVAVGIAGLVVSVFVAIAVYPWQSSAYFWDFRAFYRGGSAYLHGRSPYPVALLAALTNKQNFVYPLPVAALFAPFTLLPFSVAAALFLAVNVAALACALRVLGVTDPRCYAVAFLGLPSQYALKLGTIMPILALLLALAWRFRDKARLAVPILALLVLAKVFLWPIGVWYLTTRRVGAAVGACILTVVLVALSALPVGLGPLRTYPHLLSVLSNFESSFSWSLTSLGLSLGLAPFSASLFQYGVGGAVLAAAVIIGRRGDAALSFSLAIAASLALSPIVWGHYLVLCFVPLALRERRFSAAWLAAAWVGLDTTAYGAARSALIVAAVVGCALQFGVGGRLRHLLLRPAVAVACIATALLLFAGGAIARTALTRSVALVGQSSLVSGAATLRLGDDRICWSLWTQRVHAEDLRLAFITPSSRRVVSTLAAPLTLHDGRAQGCRPDRRARAWRHEAEARRFPYRLAVIASGRVLLDGTPKNPVDARQGPGE